MPTIAPGTQAFSLDVQIVDDVGDPVLGLVAATFPAVTVSPGGALADVVLTLSDLPAITTPHPNDNVAGGIKERTGGYYRLDYPNNLFPNPGFLSTIGEESNKHLICPRIEVSSGPGGGAYAVTITLTDSGTALPIQNAYVRMSGGAFAPVQATNASGVAVFNLDAGTYTVIATAPGYSFSGQTLVVAGTTSHAYTMSPYVIPMPSAPGLATGVLICYDDQGVVLAGVQIDIQLSAMPYADAGNSAKNAIRSATSDSSGLVTFTGLWQGGRYRARRSAGDWVDFAVPATSTFSLPDVLGVL